MTAVSGEAVTDVAAAGLRRPLNRAEQKSVCASVLRQAEERIDQRKLTRAYAALGKVITTDEQAAKLEKLGAILFPAKS